MITEIVWGIILGLAASYLLYRLLRAKPSPPKPLFYDRNQRPWVLLVYPEEKKDSAFVLWAKRLAYEYGIPVKEARPDQSPYPLPSHLSAIIFQGRYLWFTENTFDRETYRVSLYSASENWKSYLKYFRSSLRRSVSILRPGLFATHGGDFPDSYLSKAFYTSDEFAVTEDGEITTDYMGIPYHPYMEEGLRYVGMNVQDHTDFVPFREQVYVVKPIVHEEFM